MTVEIFYIILALIVGVLGYLHYIIDKQKKDIELLWTQIAILAAATARKITEIENLKKTEDDK
jgi:cell division protein FtsB